MDPIVSLIDYTVVGDALKAQLATPMETAIGIGVLVFAAILCWGVFKRLTK